ncbi:MAG: hypothetical protein B5M55_06250 [Desulfococcus sp. 4484_242]|nr:MAG: hypothetical protein B5M55_06250 [Desulfococcus sp. 4484_242]
MIHPCLWLLICEKRLRADAPHFQTLCRVGVRPVLDQNSLALFPLRDPAFRLNGYRSNEKAV